MTKELTKNNTFNLVYKREYVDSDNQQYDEYFPIYYTIFRNIPIKFLDKINTDNLKKKVKTFCDKNFNENVRPRVLAKFREMNGENAFEGTNTEFVMGHVFKMRPDLSYVPEGMNLMEELPKHTYRRHVTVDVGWGERSAFEEMQKKQIQNDIKLNNKYITLMLEPVFGGTESGDYVMVILGDTRAAYFNGLEERMKKRNADNEWKAMRDAPVGTWIEEESLMITY